MYNLSCGSVRRQKGLTKDSVERSTDTRLSLTTGKYSLTWLGLVYIQVCIYINVDMSKVLEEL